MDALPLDLPALDEQLAGGPRRGWLLNLAGAPESGKTALALWLAARWAAAGERVLYCVLKDTLNEARGRAEAQARHLGLPGLDELTTLMLAAPGQGLDDATIAALATLAQQRDASVIIVDDLDALLVEGRAPTAGAARELAYLARWQGRLIVALDGGQGRYRAGLPAPEEGDAAAHADLVLFASRPAHLQGWPAGMRGLAAVVGVELAKNRYGETATTQVSLQDGLVDSRS